MVRASWSGRSPGVFSIGGRAADLRALAREGAALVARYRVESRPQQPVRIGMSCEAPYGTRVPAGSTAPPARLGSVWDQGGAALDMTAQFAAAPLGQWQTLSIPLACLRAQGADLSHVAAPFEMTTSGQFAVSFAEIGISRAAGKARCR